MPKVSIVIPFHWMKNWQVHLKYCLSSIEKQTFTDYEVILMKVGSMPETSNRVIEAAQGELIKILYMDDRFNTINALQEIVDAFTDKTEWLVTGCVHDDGISVSNPHFPSYNDKIYTGENSIGSPSVLTMRKESCLLFDTNLSWLLDCDLYKRLHDTYGPPTVVNTPNVIIGLHEGQTSNIMTNEAKQKEHKYLMNKYA